MYDVHVLFAGYSRPAGGGNLLANCTCTLVKGPKNLIVDTMTPWDGQRLMDAVVGHGLRPRDVHYVVSTHGHSDHTGNNNMFLSARHVVGRCVSRGHVYYDCDALFDARGVYQIDENVSIVSTPGHTLTDVSVIVRTAARGVYGIVGDLFEREDDVHDESVWLDAGSECPDSQRKHRKYIMERVDWIVPGHGPMFSTAKYK